MTRVWPWVLALAIAGALLTGVAVLAFEAWGLLAALVPGIATAVLLQRRGRTRGAAYWTGAGIAFGAAAGGVVAIFVLAVALCFSDVESCFR